MYFSKPDIRSINRRLIRSPYSKNPFDAFQNWDGYRTYNAKPLWTAISKQNLVQTGVGKVYTDYAKVSFASPLASGASTTARNNEIVGPWYLHRFYTNLYNGWNISLGSGITITAQEKFDFTHIGYFISTTGDVGNGWDIDNYSPVFTIITGDSHHVFSKYTNTGGDFVALGDLLGTCYWYSGGSTYSCPGITSGCIQAYNAVDATKLPNLTLAPNNPRTCYSTNFNPTTGLCRSGVYREAWTTSNVPESFAPFGHGDMVTSIFGSRARPINNIDTESEAIGNMGVSPGCSILLGSNCANYDAQESVNGADIRVNAFDSMMSQSTSDLARSYGTLLIQGTFANVNYDTEKNTHTNVPYNAVQIGSARWLGNSNVIYADTNYSESALLNYGAYAGYGRSNYIDFACPAVNVWVNHPRFNHNNWGIWGGAANGTSMSTAFGAGIIADVAAVRTGWVWEDVVTAICQSSRQRPYRIVPSYSAEHGMGTLATTITTGSTSISITESFTGDNSVNWYYAYESGNTFSPQNNPYSIIQFGTDLTDPNYELILYRDKTSTDTTISGKATAYSGGTFDDCIRGFMGTIKKPHTAGATIYTPLFNYDEDWNPCLGWGIPNLSKALIETNLIILPPRNLTAVLETGHVKFTCNPYYSSNWHDLRIIKNNLRYPIDISDGINVCTWTASGQSIITGHDFLLQSGWNYYTAFQTSCGDPIKSSIPTSYSTAKIFVDQDLSTFSQQYLSAILKVEPYAKQYGYSISGYRYLLSSGGHYISTGNTMSSIYKFDDLIADTTYDAEWYRIARSNNLIANSDFTIHSGDSSISGWTTGSEFVNNMWSISSYPAGYYDSWSVCFTASGTCVNSGSYIHVSTGNKIAITNTNLHMLSYYGKQIQNYGTYNASTKAQLLCYSGASYLGAVDGSFTTVTGFTDDWFNFQCGFYPVGSTYSALITGTTHVAPKIYGIYGIDTAYLTSTLVDNAQLEVASGTATQYCGYVVGQIIASGTNSILITG